MTPHLASPARYRLIPHPSGVGYTAAVLDEAAELEPWRATALAIWLGGPLHPVQATNAERHFTTDGHDIAVTADLAKLLRRPMVAHLVASLGTELIPALATTTDRIFGLAADGTLIVAVSCATSVSSAVAA